MSESSVTGSAAPFSMQLPVAGAAARDSGSRPVSLVSGPPASRPISHVSAASTHEPSVIAGTDAAPENEVPVPQARLAGPGPDPNSTHYSEMETPAHSAIYGEYPRSLLAPAAASDAAPPKPEPEPSPADPPALPPRVPSTQASPAASPATQRAAPSSSSPGQVPKPAPSTVPPPAPVASKRESVVSVMSVDLPMHDRKESVTGKTDTAKLKKKKKLTKEQRQSMIDAINAASRAKEGFVGIYEAQVHF